MSGNRLYSDKEIGALIQRATELHEEASDSQDHALSLEDVEHIASDLGISPEHVRSAALELAHNIEPGKKFSLFGAPFFAEQARVIEIAVK